MAEKRMFSNQIIDSDAFLDMPATSQNLYFHLAMRADDEGFINSPKKIMRSIGANENDFDVLVAKGFLIGFESKIYVIKHWWVHNYIRQDRVKSTNYTQEKAMLSVKENGVYTLCQSSVSQVSDKSQASIEEIRLDKNSIEEYSVAILLCDEAREVAEYLYKRILDSQPTFKKPNIEVWAKDIDKAIRLDGRNKEQLIKCIDWIYTTDKGRFWIPNILSGKKLREKFDTMKIQASQKTQTQQKTAMVDEVYGNGISAKDLIERMEQLQ